MKDVNGFEEYFCITDDGKIWSKRTKRFLKQTKSKSGYYIVNTRIGGRNGLNVCFRIHRLVAEAYIPNYENKPFVNHKDGNKLNNFVNNLEWCTHQENIQHAYDNGLIDQNGTRSSCSKLSKDDVEYIRKNYKPYDKEFGATALAKKFNVAHPQISRVYNNKSYKND